MSSLYKVLDYINSQGYDDIFEYCNETGHNLEDLF